MLDLIELSALLKNQLRISKKTSLKDQLNHDYGVFFLQKLERLVPVPSDLSQLIAFLSEHFHQTKYTIFSIFACPERLETLILIEIAMHCGHITGETMQQFLLPGVVLSEQQVAMPIEFLLKNHFVSSAENTLLPANIFSNQQSDNLSENDLYHLKNHSQEQRLFYDLTLVNSSVGNTLIYFIAKIDALLSTTQNISQSQDIIEDFHAYFHSGLSESLLEVLPDDFKHGIQTFLHQALCCLQRIDNSVPPVIINPDFIDNFIECYKRHKDFLSKTALSIFSQITARPDYTDKRPALLTTINHHTQRNLQHGQLSYEIFSLINSKLCIDCRNDISILSAIPAKDYGKFFQLINPDTGRLYIESISQHLSFYEYFLLFSRLSYDQIYNLCTNTPAPIWLESLGTFEKLSQILYFFRNQPLYCQSIIAGLAHVLPQLIQKELLSKSTSLNELLSAQYCHITTTHMIEDALGNEMSSIKNLCFFHSFLSRYYPSIRFSKQYWLDFFHQQPATINNYLPYLPPKIQKSVLKSLVAQLSSDSYAAEDIFLYETLCYEQRMRAEYVALREFIERQGPNIVAYLTQSTEAHQEILSKINKLFKRVFNENSFKIGDFIEQIFSINTQENIFFKSDMLLDFLRFLRKNYPNYTTIVWKAIKKNHTILAPLNQKILQHCLPYDAIYSHQEALCLDVVSVFYDDSLEKAQICELLYEYGREDLGHSLYSALRADRFSMLRHELSQQANQTFFAALHRWGAVIKRYSNHDLPVFVTEVLLESIADRAFCASLDSVEQYQQLLDLMTTAEQKIFVLHLLSSEIFNSYPERVVNSIFQFCVVFLEHEPQFIRRLQQASSKCRHFLYHHKRQFNPAYDKRLIFSINDLIAYHKAFNSQSPDSSQIDIFFDTFYASPSEVEPLIKTGNDWECWLSLVPQKYKNTAFELLLTQYFNQIVSLLQHHTFTAAFCNLSNKEIFSLTKHPMFSDGIAFIRLGLSPRRMSDLNILLKSHHQKVITPSERLSDILILLPQCRIALQYAWIIWLLTNALSALAAHIKHPSFTLKSFASCLRVLDAHEARHLLNKAGTQAALCLSTLWHLGAQEKTLSAALTLISGETYINIWQSFGQSLSTQEYHETFEMLHDPLNFFDRQSLVQHMYLASNFCLQTYIRVLIKIFNMNFFEQRNEQIRYYFTIPDSFLCVIAHTSCPNNIRNQIIEALFFDNKCWLKSLRMSVQEYDLLLSLLSEDLIPEVILLQAVLVQGPAVSSNHLITAWNRPVLYSTQAAPQNTCEAELSLSEKTCHAMEI